MPSIDPSPSVVCLSGGRAGAAFVDQLARLVPAEKLTIVLNTGNDNLQGIGRDMPDIDLHLSVLADDPVAIAKIPAARNQLLDNGHTLTAAVRTLRTRFNIGPTLLPLSDGEIATQLLIEGEAQPLADWVGVEPPTAAELRYPDSARTTRSVLQALNTAAIVLLAPANPYLDLLPMLNAYPVRATLEDHPTAVVVGLFPPAISAWEKRFLAALKLPLTLTDYLEQFNTLLDGCVYPDSITPAATPEELSLRPSAPSASDLAHTAYQLALDLCN